jgi:predicted aspartyl protease
LVLGMADNSSTAPEFESVVPFDSIGTLIIVKATVNHGQEYRFLVDTGAGGSLIDKKAAAALNLWKGSQEKVTDALGVQENGDKVILDSFRIGKFEFTQYQATVTDLSNLSDYGIRIDGIVGASFLKFFKVKIDYDRQQISFSKQTNWPDKDERMYNRYKMKLKTSPSGHIYAEFKLNHVHESFWGLVDTGAGGVSCLEAPMRYIEQLQPAFNCTVDNNSGIKAGVYGKSDTACTRLFGMKIGKFQQKNLLINFSGINEFIINSKFLAHFTVIINYPASEMALIPNGQKKFETNLLYYGFIAMKDEGGKLRVIKVDENSPASIQRLKINDEIVSIALDNQPLQLDDYFYLPNDQIHTLHLNIRNQFGEREVIIRGEWAFPEI